MFIIQALSVKKRLLSQLVAVVAISSTPVLAQQTESLSWPKTFSGQPDFDFKRGEILKEFDEKGGIDGVDIKELATMKRLLQTTIIDPFKPHNLEGTLKDTPEDNNKINKAALAALFGEIPDNITKSDAQNYDTQLPGFEQKSNVDLTEFSTFLENVINQKVKLNKTTLKERDFTDDLNRLIIQSIATSPVKYIIINNDKFNVGDRFLLPIQSKIYDSEIEALLAPYLPQPESFSEEVYQKYVDIKNEAIARYKSENSGSKANVVTHNISVTIRDILHRKVKVSVYGNEYELKMKYAF